MTQIDIGSNNIRCTVRLNIVELKEYIPLMIRTIQTARATAEISRTEVNDMLH